MRTIIFYFTLYCLISTEDLYSQTYFKLLNNTIWYENVNYGWGGQNTYVYKQTSDTIINSISYSKIQDSSNNNVAFLREDTINKIVYKIEVSDTIETKLYDFNLVLNDTFSVYFQNYFYPAQVFMVDTINTLQGPRKRYVWKINTGLFIYIQVIESVGSTENPISVFHPIQDPVYCLVCSYQNSIQNFNNSCGVACPNIITSDYKESDEEITQFFPNPVADILTINKLDNSAVFVLIFNSLGQEVYRGKVTSIKQEVNVFALKNGIYALMIQDNSNRIDFLGNIIKQ